MKLLNTMKWKIFKKGYEGNKQYLSNESIFEISRLQFNKKNSLILYEIQTSIDMPNASVKIIDFPIHYCHLNVIKAYFDREMRNQKY